MKKFIISILLFTLFSLLVGEIIVRKFYLTTDIPKRQINSDGIQNYVPGQTGFWKGGTHHWVINELGWPGCLPDKMDNLITIIGDSYIENFMNPQECHQCAILQNNTSKYNFLEAARSGVSLIEAMEISKQFDDFTPVYQLIYVNDKDFEESVSDIKVLKDITQINLKNNELSFGEMKSPKLKSILYNWKLLYYFYLRFNSGSNKNDTKIINSKEYQKSDHITKIKELLVSIKKLYILENKILVFHPNSNKKIIQEVVNLGYKTIVLDSSKHTKSWSFEFDSHWTCYGHQQVAQQVYDMLVKNYGITN